MRVLLLHCTHLEIKDTKKSDRPKGITPDRKKTNTVFDDILGIFICVEKADKNEYAEDLVKEIYRHRNMIGKKNRVIIIPFTHLSGRLASPSDSIAIIKHIKKRLIDEKYYVEDASFGYHNQFALSWVVPGHRGSIAFRLIPNRIETELENLVLSVGFEKVSIALNKLKYRRDNEIK